MEETKEEEGTFTRDLRALLDSGEGADVTLVIGNSQFPIHSQILAARSPVLAALLREARNGRVEVTGLRDCVLRQVLSFVYTDTAPELESVAAELLAAADRYNLPLLKKRCEQQMVRDISVDNAAGTAELAVRHSCPGLTSAAVEFVAGHPGVLATEGWARLLRDSAEAALEVSRQLAAVLRREPPEEVADKRSE